MDDNKLTLIIRWQDGRSTVKACRDNDDLLNTAEIARFLGATVCMWLDCAGWVWSK